MNNKVVCQGDVNLIPATSGRCPDCGATFQRAEAKARPNGTLAYGESTGHSHAVLEQETATVFDTPTGAWLEAHVANASVTHQEHGAVVPPPGLSHIHIDKVFDYSAQQLRNVVD